MTNLEQRRKKLNLDKINETVDKIVGLVIGQASRHQSVKDDVSISIQNAIKDVIEKDLEPDEESGFSFTEYNHVEIYQGPTKLMNLPDEQINEATGQAVHGEIIVKVNADIRGFMASFRY